MYNKKKKHVKSTQVRHLEQLEHFRLSEYSVVIASSW